MASTLILVCFFSLLVCSEVTVATRSSLYPDQMATAVTRISPDGGSATRDDLYSPECQRRSEQLDEPQ